MWVERPLVELQTECPASFRQIEDQIFGHSRRRAAQPGYPSTREPPELIKTQFKRRRSQAGDGMPQIRKAMSGLVTEEKQGQVQVMIGHATGRQAIDQTPQLNDLAPNPLFRPTSEKQSTAWRLCVLLFSQAKP